MKLDINRLHPSLRPALNALVTANNALNPVVAARMRDNLLEPNSPSPKRISLGRSFGPSGEGRQDGADDETSPLDPATHFVPDSVLHAEDTPEVPSLGYPPADVALVMRELPGYSRVADVAQMFSALGPAKTRQFVDQLRHDAQARDAEKRRTTSDSAARADWNRSIGITNDYAAAMAREAARRDAAALAERIAAPFTDPGAVTPVNMGPGYDPVGRFNERLGEARPNGARATDRSSAPAKGNGTYNAQAAFMANMADYAAKRNAAVY